MTFRHFLNRLADFVLFMSIVGLGLVCLYLAGILLLRTF